MVEKLTNDGQNMRFYWIIYCEIKLFAQGYYL